LLCWIEGHREDAFRYMQEFITCSRERRDLQGVSLGLIHLANLNLQIDSPRVAEALAREGFEVTRDNWRGSLGFAAGALAESLARAGAADAGTMLSQLERIVDELDYSVARPQLLRARAVLQARAGRLDEAIATLAESAMLARAQHAGIELAQTLALLASVARRRGRNATARMADNERLTTIERIGPETRGLTWTAGLDSRKTARRQSPLFSTDKPAGTTGASC
jgi:hypothetical protein